MSKDINVTDGTVLETLNNKVDLDGGNYPGSGLEEYINTYHHSQITNCLLEIPQRIKYTLKDGVFTLLSGTVVIVPYGTEDLTSQYQKGATFINDNFRVYDTQFADDKFFVWAELVNDIVDDDKTAGDNDIRPLQVDITQNNLFHFSITTSGTTDYNDIYNASVYRTDLNIIKKWETNIGLTSSVSSLPICTIKSNSSTKYVYESIPQVFNGMGYIGSTIWVDKGVKCLMPNGRNKDGSLNNLEFTIPRIVMRHFPATQYTSFEQMFAIDSELGMGESTLVELDYIPTSLLGSYKNWILHTPTNIVYQWNGVAYTPKDTHLCIIAHQVTIVDGVIKSFKPNQSFRAIDYSDKSEVSGWGMTSGVMISLTPSASGTWYTAPANGIVRAWGYINTAQNDYINIYTDKGGAVGCYVPQNWGSPNLSLRVAKGEKFQVTDYNSISNARLNFYYLKSEV
jgi:hypothetical protein